MSGVSRVPAVLYTAATSAPHSEQGESQPVDQLQRRLVQTDATRVLYGIGMRRVQVAGLKIGYIVIGRLIIRVIEDKDRKEGKHRDLPLSPVLLEILRAYWH